MEERVGIKKKWGRAGRQVSKDPGEGTRQMDR